MLIHGLEKVLSFVQEAVIGREERVSTTAFIDMSMDKATVGGLICSGSNSSNSFNRPYSLWLTLFDQQPSKAR